MDDPETQVRTLIERWADAVARRDLEGVVRDHADDVVVFDVPPPEDGVRGIDAYRELCPSFFEWQRHGARFELDEVDVVAGERVAYAHALLRCESAEEPEHEPDRHLQLTLGLRRERDGWVVSHEHHSFTSAAAG